MIYKLQNGRTIPLGGDYLEYLQSIPETYGGSIQPSIKVESLPKKFNGSQQAARTYAEGYQKGAKPVTKAIDNAGQKIFNTTKNVAMFVPGPTGAITWLGQMGADTANGEYSKVAKDLGAAVLIGAGLKGAQVGAKSVGRTLAGKGVNIPWLDAYDYSALRNEYLNRAAKRTRIITPNKGWENLSNFDVYKDAFYNHPAVETTETITEIPKHYTDTVGNIEDIHKLKMHPNSAIETGYVNFIDDTKPFRKDLKGEYDIYRDGTTYMNGHPTKQGVLRQDLSGNEFLEYPRNSGVRYYTGHIKTEGYTPTLVHIGYPNMSGTVINPRIDPMKRLDKNYLWWQRNNPFWSHGNFTTRINDIVPSESAIDISRDFPTRLTDAIDLSDPKLDIVQMEFNPLTKTFGRVKYHIPQSTISPQEAVTTYHFDGRIPLTRPISFKERLGWTRGERMQPDPKNPIPISLINRSDSYLPIEGDSFVLESPEISKKLASVHFTMNEPVTSHGGGSWDSASTTLLFPYGNIRKVTGPINIEPMDTFFPNYNGLRFSTKGAKVLTGDRAVHDYYTQHGVDSKFSEELEALLKEYKSKAGSAEKYLEEHNWLPDEGYFPLRDAETALSDRIQQIHYDFVDQNAVRPTYEDLLKLEKIEGLKTGAEPLSWSTMRTPLEDKLGYSYFSAPATHSNLTFYDPGDNISGLPKPMQEFIKWMWEHKADYRKQGGIIKGQDGVPEISGGELQPAIVKPAPVKIVLRTDPITKDTPITHSSLHAPDFFVSKGSDDPTYNFLKANCSDATGEVLELFTGQDFTSGITTPIGVSRKVRKIYGSKPGYSERNMTSRYQEFEVPWYDYRRAKDLVNHNTLQMILNKYNPKPNTKANVIANWAKERPTLPYYLDEDNNVHYYKE